MAARRPTEAQTKLHKLMMKYECRCRYCGVDVRRRSFGEKRFATEATIDHIVPRSKGGSEDMENLALACNYCNGKKGNLDLAEFLACNPQPYSAPKASVFIPPIPPEAMHRAYKAVKGTLAAAIASGEVESDGSAYRRAKEPWLWHDKFYPQAVPLVVAAGSRTRKMNRRDYFDKR